MQIDNLPVAEIKKLLGADANLSDAQIAAIQSFLQRVGGIENAKRAVEMLGHLEKKAAVQEKMAPRLSPHGVPAR